LGKKVGIWNHDLDMIYYRGKRDISMGVHTEGRARSRGGRMNLFTGEASQVKRRMKKGRLRVNEKREPGSVFAGGTNLEKKVKRSSQYNS